jgi:hypothetical protein
MASGIVQVTEGVGKKLDTWSRIIGGNTVEDEFVLPGEFPYASYTAVATGVSSATAASHMMQIMAGAGLNVRIRRIRVNQLAAAGGVNTIDLSIVRLTTAGTGGTVITPSKLDNGDAAAGATAMTLPTVKGTEGAILWDESMWVGTAAIPPSNGRWEWVQHPGSKPIIIPAGATNGIAIKNTALATATFSITVELVETSFL